MNHLNQLSFVGVHNSFDQRNGVILPKENSQGSFVCLLQSLAMFTKEKEIFFSGPTKFFLDQHETCFGGKGTKPKKFSKLEIE